MKTLKLYTRGDTLTIAEPKIRESHCLDREEEFTIVNYTIDGFNPSKEMLQNFFRVNGPVVETLIEEDDNMYSLGKRRIHGINSSDSTVLLELT